MYITGVCRCKYGHLRHINISNKPKRQSLLLAREVVEDRGVNMLFRSDNMLFRGDNRLFLR